MAPGSTTTAMDGLDPGYDWHPGRVAWARGYDTNRLDASASDGYDYHGGRLSYVGRNNQFSYSDSDFGEDFESVHTATADRTMIRRFGTCTTSLYAAVTPRLWVLSTAPISGRTTMPITISPPITPGTPLTKKMVRLSNRPMEKG